MEGSGNGRIGVFEEQRAKRGTPGVRTERTLEEKACEIHNCFTCLAGGGGSTSLRVSWSFPNCPFRSFIEFLQSWICLWSVRSSFGKVSKGIEYIF